MTSVTTRRLRGAAILLAEWFNLNGTQDDDDEAPPETAADSPTRSSGYIRELELLQLLDAGNTEAVVRFVETKCIESYRNGVEQGQASPAFRAPLPW